MDLHVPDSAIQNVSLAERPSLHQQGEERADHLIYWEQQLQDVPLILDLPTDYPRPLTLSGARALHSFVLSPQLSTMLQTLSKQEDTSLFVTLLTAFQLLLHRYSGQDDLLVGIPRLEHTSVGYEYVNFLVLHGKIAGNPAFRSLLRQMDEVVQEAQVHQDVSFEQVMLMMQPERESNRHPLFQVMFALEAASVEGMSRNEFSSLSFSEDSGTAKCDLIFWLQETRQGVRGWVEYSSDLFAATTIVRLVSHWQRLLEGIVVDPGQCIADLPMLSMTEWQQQVVEWNATEADYPHRRCFHELFEAQVKRTPEAIAVVCEQEQLTYYELNQRANQLAHYLQNLGVQPETIVPLLAERGTAFLIAILAIFKAGGAYLPLDPHHPPARIRHILAHSGSRLVLAAKGFAPLLSQALVDMPTSACPQALYLEDLLIHNEHPADNVPARATPSNLAYVIYTSGSTGMPKGVMIEHRGMLNHLYAKVSALHLTATDCVAQTASQCFDISVWQFLAVLLVGGRVHIFHHEVAHHPMQLLVQVEQNEISILETVPSLLRVMLESIENGNSTYPRLEKLRWLVPTGEALPPEFCRRWLTVYPRIPLLNAYGPTECSDDVTHFPIYQPLADTQVHTPIGRPINNMRLYILDRKLRPLPIRVSGELYVGGVGVGRGYLNDAQRTAEAFIADPFSHESGTRLYKTGDLARYLPDGNIEFLGRIDHQVKIRGNRIELGEIEALLRQHAGVQDVVVIVREDIPGDKSLIAYVVTSTGVTSHGLHNYLKEKLPDYMLPAAFVLLEALPLTPNGKVDRRALPAPEYSRSERNESFVAPTLPVHQQLIQIWEELLDVRPIGIQDNFFELGGHSLLAVRLIDQIEQVCGKKIPPTTLLTGPTIEQLATVLLSQEESDPETALGTVQARGSNQPLPSKHRPLLSSIKTIWTRSRSSGRVNNSAMPSDDGK